MDLSEARPRYSHRRVLKFDLITNSAKNSDNRIRVNFVPQDQKVSAITQSSVQTFDESKNERLQLCVISIRDKRPIFVNLESTSNRRMKRRPRNLSGYFDNWSICELNRNGLGKTHERTISLELKTV